MYILYSGNSELIQNKLNQLFKPNQLFADYDKVMLEDINQLYEYCNQQKLLFNPECLVLKTTCKELDSNLELLTKVHELLSNNNEFKVCFIIASELLSIKSETKKMFNEIFELKDITEKQKELLIETLLDKQNVSYNKSLVLELCKKLPNNESIIRNEIYKIHELNSNSVELISDYNEYNIFKIFEYWFNKQYDQMLKLLEQVFNDADQWSFLLNFFIKRMTEFYFTKKLVKQNISLQEIAKMLKVNFFVLKNDWNRLSQISILEIEKILYNLYNIEKESRIYQIDIKTSLKLFFLLKDINGK